jgi:thioredoxin-like negative regulator of GroEL
LTTAHFNLALALLRRGETAEARQHFEAVISTAPNDFEARLHLGEILLVEGQYDSAIINLQAASQSPRPEVRTAARKALQAAQSAK